MTEHFLSVISVFQIDFIDRSHGARPDQQNKISLSSPIWFVRFFWPLDPNFVFASVLLLSVRYKQRGHIPNNLVEHHRQSPLGKLKGGAAVGVSPPVERNREVRSVPPDFK